MTEKPEEQAAGPPARDAGEVSASKQADGVEVTPASWWADRRTRFVEASMAVPPALWRGARNFFGDGCFNHSAAISYFALLSVAPFLSFLASTLGYFLGSSQEGVDAAMDRFRILVPGLGPQVSAVAGQVIAHSGTISLASLVAAIWVASFVFISIQIAVGQIFRQPKKHRSWRLVALSTLWETVRPFLLFFASMTLLMLAFALKNLLAVLRAAAPERARGLIEFLESIPSVPVIGSFLLSAIVFVVVLQVLTTRILPWRALIPAALVGALGLEIAKVLFAIYLGYVSRALTFTGSAAAAVIFMLWIYYAAIVLLYSIEVAAVLSGERH